MSWTMEGEQLLFTVERPGGKRIMTFTLSIDRLASPSELEPLPVPVAAVSPCKRPDPTSRRRRIGDDQPVEDFA